IGIHHKHRGSVIVQIPDNHRHFCLSCQLAGPPSPVSSHHFISISARTHNPRLDHAVLNDTFHCLLHFFIIQYLKRMVFKWPELAQWNSGISSLHVVIFCSKQFVIGSQPDLFRTLTFHLQAPPRSGGGIPLPQFLSDREDRYSFPPLLSPPPVQTSGYSSQRYGCYCRIPHGSVRKYPVRSLSGGQP